MNRGGWRFTHTGKRMCKNRARPCPIGLGGMWIEYHPRYLFNANIFRTYVLFIWRNEFFIGRFNQKRSRSDKKWLGGIDKDRFNLTIHFVLFGSQPKLLINFDVLYITIASGTEAWVIDFDGIRSTFLRQIRYSVPVNWLSPCGTDECVDHSDLILLKTRLGHAALLGPSSGSPVEI